MKKTLYILFGFLVLTSCDDFSDLNKDPDVIDSPPVESIFTYVEKSLGDYKGSEWYYDNHQMMTWLQYLIMGQANGDDINSLQPRGAKYDVFYTTILPHLLEIRRQIAAKSETQQVYYKNLEAITYIVQVYHALKVTDIYGSIPYDEAGLGRYQGKLDPLYNDQENLFNTFLDQLDNAIATLSADQGTQIDMSTEDFIYKGDWNKWIKCANAIKLRIALRLESENLNLAKQIISEVNSDGRIFESTDDEFVYFISPNWYGTGGASMDWKGVLWAARPMVDFMKETIDPRIRIYYELNGYTRATINAIKAANGTMPVVIDTVNDNQVLFTTGEGEKIYGYRYQGAPVDRNDPNKDDYDYSYIVNNIGSGAVQLSKYNQRLLMSTTYNYGDGPGTGGYVDVLISYSEVCFMMSEFILKGYINGDAAEYYQKGIEASMKTYDFIAQEGQLDMKIAQTSYPYTPIGDTEIADYLAKPEIQLNGTNDLEKVYIQEYLNFYRLPEEGWVLARRTGYPKFGSTLLARGYVDSPDLKFPRRFPTPDPGDLNRENWHNANQDQGFSGDLNENPDVLNAERLWWDKNNPAIGAAN